MQYFYRPKRSCLKIIWFTNQNYYTFFKIKIIRFFLYKCYCNENTISIVSFNLSEKSYSPVNSTNDYSRGFLIYLVFHFCYLEHVWWRLLQKLVLPRACLMKVITEIHQKRAYNLEFEFAVVQYNKTLIDLIFG